MNLNRKWAIACVLAVSGAAGVVATGCGDDSTSTPPKTDAGTDAAKTDAGNTPVDSGQQPGTDGGGDAAMTTLYDRLGGRAGIRTAVQHVVEDKPDGELADPQLQSYFYIEVPGIANPAGAGVPDPNTIEECFTDLVANAAGGPEMYPTTEDGGFTCRDMKTAHKNLHITGAAFQKFVSIAAAKLAMLGVSQDDLTTLGGALLGTQSDIVDAVRVGAQAEAGVDAGNNYGANCDNIDGGDAATSAIGNSSGCTTP
jgi:hypothetical protein